jgi:hypothetical protein
MLIFKYMSGKVWCEFLQVWAGLIQKDEALDLYKRSSEPSILSFTFTRLYANPIYLTSYILVATPWTLPTDANYRVKTPPPDPTHTILNTKMPALSGSPMCVLLYTNVFNRSAMQRIVSRGQCRFSTVLSERSADLFCRSAALGSGQ